MDGLYACNAGAVAGDAMDGLYACNAGAVAGDAMDGLYACNAGAVVANAMDAGHAGTRWRFRWLRWLKSGVAAPTSQAVQTDWEAAANDNRYH